MFKTNLDKTHDKTSTFLLKRNDKRGWGIVLK